MILKIIKTVFFTEIIKSMSLTLRTMFTRPVTRRYPKVKRPVAAGYRGLHALAKNERGKMKCVGCGLCSAHCPAQCISIHTSEGENHTKVVERYEIDVLRCVYCAFCVEACPFGAITMSEHYEYSSFSRDEFYMTKEKLLENWDKYFPGEKGKKYFEKFWHPLKQDFVAYEGQAIFRKRIQGDKGSSR